MPGRWRGSRRRRRDVRRRDRHASKSAEMPEGLPANDQKERLLKELKFAVEAVNDAEQSVVASGAR